MGLSLCSLKVSQSSLIYLITSSTGGYGILTITDNSTALNGYLDTIQSISLIECCNKFSIFYISGPLDRQVLALVLGGLVLISVDSAEKNKDKASHLTSL